MTKLQRLYSIEDRLNALWLKVHHGRPGWSLRKARIEKMQARIRQQIMKEWAAH